MRGNFLIPLASLALAVALTLLFTLPRWNGASGAPAFAAMSVTELKRERAVYQEAFDKMREIELARTGLAAKYNKVSEEDRERLLTVVGDHPDSVRMVLDIENRARARGLKLRSVSASAETGGAREHESDAEPILFSFSAVGPYTAFVPFLADLEASVRLADIESVDFESKKEGEYVYSVSLSFYQLKKEGADE
jgi:hypothetical protein